MDILKCHVPDSLSVSEAGEQSAGGPPVHLRVIVPEGQSAGTYANGFGTWFNQTDFTLDCLVHLPQQPETDEAGNTFVVQPAQVVARVKFPPALIFRLMQNLNQAMTMYETQFGPISPLGDPIPPPLDNPPTAD